MTISFQCPTCKHYSSKGKCKAYSKGIPQEILSGAVDHTKPYPGDNGIRFKQKESQE